MLGQDIDTLNVIAQTDDGKEFILWSKKENQGNLWKNALVDWSHLELNSSFVVIFEAFRGASYLVDLSIVYP